MAAATATLHVTSERLGTGASASVHIAKLGGRTVAAKLSGSADAARRQCRREARRYRRFRAHSRITQGLGVGENSGNVVLVTELLAGGSLFDALRARRGDPLPACTRLRIGRDIADALAFLHKTGYSCGDVKTLNVLLSARLNAKGGLPAGACAKLCDFGLSRRLRDEPEGDADCPAPRDVMFATTNDPDAGGVAGTFAYLAPESFENTVRSAQGLVAADVFALGVVLWELATGLVPWQGASLGELMRAVRENRRLAWPASARDAAGEAFVQLVGSCWSRDPSRRPSARSVASALGRLLKEEGVDAPLPSPRESVSSFSSATGSERTRGSFSSGTDADDIRVVETFESEDSAAALATITEIDSDIEDDEMDDGSFDINITLFHRSSAPSRKKFVEIDSPVELSDEDSTGRVAKRARRRVYSAPPMTQALQKELEAMEQADISDALLWTVMQYGDM